MPKLLCTAGWLFAASIATVIGLNTYEAAASQMILFVAGIPVPPIGVLHGVMLLLGAG